MARDEEIRSSPQSARSDTGGRLVENDILLSIPEREFRLVQPHLEFVHLDTSSVLQDPGKRIEFAFFLNSGLASLLVVTTDARSVEVGMVGKDGFVGAPLTVGMRDTSQRAIVQIAADAFRIKWQILEDILADAPHLRQRMHHYVVIQGLQVAQLAACNRLHEIEQRLARWLLMTQDRLGGDSIPITHDMLAQMLGSGRPSVSVAAGMLQRGGVIEYTRGAVKVLNRRGLESAACECYDAIRKINHSARN
jgi:CRP-like cAMP-binding protein